MHKLGLGTEGLELKPNKYKYICIYKTKVHTT